MVDIPETELRELGREIADSVVGAGKITDVDVVTMPDGYGSLAHYFSFQLDRGKQSWAATQLRLGQKLRDELMARGDDTYPFVRFLNHQDWDKRFHA